MPNVIPCRSCLPLDCSGFTSDNTLNANPFTIYSLNQPAFSFALDCPPGVDCNNAPFLQLDCCGDSIFVDLLGVTGGQRATLINDALARCVRAWQFCGLLGGGGPGGGGPGGGGPIITPPSLPLFFSNRACCRVACFGGSTFDYCVPGGTVIMPGSQAAADAMAVRIACSRGNACRVSVGNTRQCYTATCPPGDSFTSTRCVEAGTYGECLFCPTDADLQAAQQFYDQTALDQATAEANADLAAHGCLVCNPQLHDFGACPGDPSKVVSITIPAGRFCTPVGTNPKTAEYQAQAALINAIAAGLQALGCGCLVTVNYATFDFTATCNAIYMQTNGVNIVGPNLSLGPGTIHSTGAPGTTYWLVPLTYTGPTIKFYFP